MSCESNSLNACELEGITETVSGVLTDLCTIKRATLADDGRGGRTRTINDLATAVPCLVRPAGWRATEVSRADKMTGETQWDIYLPAGQDVKAATDQIVVTSLSNRIFEVIGMKSASLEILRVVQATEVL